MNKTQITINSYNQTANQFSDRFMDLKLYKESFYNLLSYIPDNATILDIGCGPGNVSVFLNNSNDTFKITGIDLSESMIELAKKNDPRSSYILSDIRDFNYGIENYHVIIAAFCIPFLYDEEAKKLIEDIGIALKKNGILYLSCMQGSGYNWETPSFATDEIFFFNYYSEEWLIEQFDNNNLKIEKKITQDYYNKDGSALVDMIFILKKS